MFWAEAYRRIGGEPMVIPPALQATYADDHPLLVIRKPSQVGATEFNINLACWAADNLYAGRGVILYLLPTQEMADRISQVRVARAITESSYLTQRATPDAGVAKLPANVHRRSIGQGVIYFTGSENETQYSGIDADMVILDEFDLMDEKVLSIAQARLRSSRRPRTVVTSTPTIAEFGVSHLYEHSDQRHYELACPECNQWQEPIFPDSVDWTKLAVVCHDCGTTLDPWHQGRWVAIDQSASEIRGYQLNRLVLPDPPLGQMKLALDGKIQTLKEDFYRQDLGQPFSSPESRLTPEILDECIEPWRPPAPLKINVMGIDVGKKLHVVIRGSHSDRWFLMEAFTADSFEEIENCFKCYQITSCVVDALPETREARRFQERHPGVVWLAQYLQHGIDLDWNWREGVVRAPRTFVIDEMMRRFRDREHPLPQDVREIEGGEYFRQLQAPVRKTELDKWGHPVAVYVHRRADDFAHAEVYATMAAIRADKSGVIMFRLGWGPNGAPYKIDCDSSDYAS